MSIKDFKEKLVTFLEGKDPRISAMALTRLDSDDSLFQEWMSPPAYCWVVAEAEAAAKTEAFRKVRYVKGARCVLILIKAQHPLCEDGSPGEEYRVRLDRALELGKRVSTDGFSPVFMTVGGTHVGHESTLAEAGALYLMRHGVPSSDILLRHAIFSGNDEDWIACDYFLSNPEFTDLYIVASTGQYVRSYASCLVKGVYPRHELVCFLEGWQKPMLELFGPWSFGGFSQDPSALREQAKATAKRHIEEAQ